MSMADERTNKKIFLWSLSQANHNKKNWCFRVKKFYCDIQMQHLNNPLYDFSNALQDVSEVLIEYFEIDWYDRMAHSPKLRTYRQFKQDCKTACYLKQVYNKNHRSALAKFRCGVAPIRLETGRYENLPVEDRMCPTCHSEVETEEHVLIRCATYRDVREDLFLYAESLNDDFMTFDDIDKLLFVLNDERMTYVSAKTCYLILMARRLFLYGF